MKKNITYSDIAKYTNLSTATISRYFNSPENLTKETSLLIENALKELNYKKNKVAKIFSNGKTEFIGIIAPKLELHFYSYLLNSILNTYSRYGYKFLVFTSNGNIDEEKEYIDELLAYQIEGLIMISSCIPSIQLKDYNIPIVGIERESKYISSVDTNNYLGASLATNTLIENNCDVLIHINSPISEEIPSIDRIKAFENICLDKNIEHMVFYEVFNNDISDTTSKLFNIFKKIEAKYNGKKIGVFLSNDTLANYFIKILVRNNKSIPDDYEVIGFDDSPAAIESFIPLTSIKQDVNKITQNTLSILTEGIKINRKNKKGCLRVNKHVVIDPTIVKRESTL
ncbi:LacI family DNA-binding transcriptional regulator [Intestinibacter bartlettii]|uniref:LacI family DNA-binding transcriptional regulator n=1 Tax=Intestinibacter bartlettii TaxID=261299 RepID=UPI00248ADF4F|nr:LacI family DNA-binding transcriptional regulator [Intestinibacter bartlettii]